MKPAFVPFSASLPNAAQTPADATAGSPKKTPAHGFQPVCPGNQSSPAPGQAPAGREPKITLERDGERVTQIRIECPCGNVIELVCD
jgi:hypothetical protein